MLIHGMSKTSEFRSWACMMQRCYNKKNQRYKSYGGRGISVCKRWMTANNFLFDMGIKPSKDHSLDRKNNDLGYSKENCKWSTRSEQQKNKAKYYSPNLPRGDNHWTRKNKVKARRIARTNIIHAHGKLENNPNSKMTHKKADDIRNLYKENIHMNIKEFYLKYGKTFGVGRETTRKVIRKILW